MIFKKIPFLILLSAITFSCSNNEEEEEYIGIDLSERLYAGGDTTIFAENSTAYRNPAANIFGSDLAIHLEGDAQFEQAFVTAPAQVNNGLGSIFNNTSCVSCHPKDGRAAFPTNFLNLSGLLLRSSVSGTDDHGGPNPVPGFGTQIQNQAVFGTLPEARYQVTFETKNEILADGTTVTLRKPIITLFETYMAFPADGMLSPRIATPVFGLGLLEAIPENNLLALQDINDNNNDQISGKANYVWDPIANQLAIGRFGWKAGAPNVLVQCAGAYVDDMGVTNYVFPNETGANQFNGQDGLNDDPEISNAILDQVAFYCRTLGVPAPRNITNQSVKNGARIFEQIDCSKCHTPKQQTGFHSITALANQTIFPYTDLLLHDMGEDLADNRPDFLATGNEWKTRPLWGIGLTQVINGHTNFLHDGRARNITEAILWHGGEALNAKNKFKQLSVKDRNDLLTFINSL